MTGSTFMKGIEKAKLHEIEDGDGNDNTVER